MPKHIERLVVGKKSYCWTCDEVFILDGDALKEDKPRCIPCRTGVKPVTIESEAPLSPQLEELLAKLN